MTGAMTVAAWVWPNTTAGVFPILSKYNTSVGQRSYIIQQIGADIEWAVYPSTVNHRSVTTTTAALTAGVFNHVVCTFDPASQALTVYVNGVAQTAPLNPGSITVPSVFDSSIPVLLGAVVGGGGFGSFLGGRIDEVGLYNRALSAGEVTALYNAGNPNCLDTPEFTTLATLPNGGAGSPYWQTLTALLGHPPYSFAVTSGTLPAGLTLSSAGLLSGTPLLASTSTFTVTLTDAAGGTAQRQFTLTVDPTLPCVTLDGAWARWPAEGSGVETINGFTAGLSNGVAFTPGVVGQAFLFDGVNDFVRASVPYLPIWGYGVSSDKNLTIELWMRMDAPAAGGGAWLAGYGNPDFPFLTFSLQVDASQRLRILGTPAQGPVVEVGRWYHVAAIYESGYAKLYVDGALVTTVAATFQSEGGPLYLGSWPPGFRFRGAIDEPTVFTRALSAAEVAAIYSAGSAGKCQSRNNTVPNGSCEVIATTILQNPGVNILGLAFDPWNQPFVAWKEASTDRRSRWTYRTNGAWIAPHTLQQSGEIGGPPDALGFALRADGVPFFHYSVDNVWVGGDSFTTGFYRVNGAEQPTGPGTLLHGFYGAQFSHSGGGWIASAFMPGASLPDYVFWRGFAGDALYNGIHFPNDPPPANFDFFINDNGVRALIYHRRGVRLSRTAGEIDGPIITSAVNGRSGNVAVTVDSNDVFHALISHLHTDADWANGKMVHATSLNGTNWSFTDLGPGVDLVRSLCVDIALSPDGRLGAAYYRVGKLWYTELINGHWVQTAVSTHYGYSEQAQPAAATDVLRLAFDRNGQPAIAIYDPGTTSLLLCRPGAAPAQPPVAIAQDLTTPEDTPLAIGLSGTDPNGDSLAFSLVSTPTHGVLSGTSPVLFYTPEANYFGPDSFKFQVDDGHGGTSVATISIMVAPVNDSPVANPQSLTTAEDTPLPFVLTGSDVEDTSPAILSVGMPAHGTLSGTLPNLTYTPALNYYGPDSFIFTVSDSANAPSTATISIAVTPVNDPPVASAQTVPTPEDTPVTITLTGMDVDGDTLSYAVTSLPTHGILSGTPPNLTYAPETNYFGLDSFQFQVDDGHGGTSVATISIMVAPVNDPPVVSAPTSLLTSEDAAVAFSVTASDVEGDTLTYNFVAAHGAVSGTAPNFSYTPAADYNGMDSIEVRVSDGNGGIRMVAVAVTITSVPDAPLPPGNVRITTAPNTPVPVALTAYDGDGDPVTFRLLGGPTRGTLSGVPPNLTYTPLPNFLGEDSLTCQASDPSGRSGVGVIVIEVTAGTTTFCSSNLVLNPGFEAGAANWNTIPLGSSVRLLPVSNPVHTGGTALCVSNRTASSAGVSQNSLMNVLQTSNTYLFSAWVHGDSMTNDNFTLGLVITDATPQKFPVVASRAAAQSNGWVQLIGGYSLIYTGAPTDVRLSVAGPAPGVKFYVDDVEARCITIPQDGNLLPNGSFELGTANWLGRSFGQIAAVTSPVHSGNLAVQSLYRTSVNSGPAQNIPGLLQSGTTYLISAWVYVQSQNPTGEVMRAIVRRQDAAGTNFFFFGGLTGLKESDGWRQMAGTYHHLVTGGDTNLVLYFEGPDTNVTYVVDDVRITPWTGPPLAQESFNYLPGTTLPNQGNGPGFAQRWGSETSFVVNAASLAYPGLASEGGSLSIAPTSSRSQLRTLVTPLGADGTTRYVSFLVRPDAPPPAGVSRSIHLRLNGSSTLVIGKVGSTDLYSMETSGGSGRVASTNRVVSGSTELLVVRCDFAAGNDTFKLYVNPTPGQPEPAFGVVKNDLNVGSLASISIVGDMAFTIDEIRIGETFASVVPGTTSPLILLQPPTHLAVVEGMPAALSVSAAGAVPLGYQWRKDGFILSDGGAISGANSATLSFNPAALSDAGSYDVIVGSASGAMTSSVAVVTVLIPTTATALANATRCLGESASFSTVASGTGPHTYQWRKDGVNIGGATDASYSIASVVAGDAAAYCVVVTGAANKITNCATLMVLAPVTAGGLSGVIAQEGSNVMLTVTAGGTGPLSFVWRKDGGAPLAENGPVLSLDSVNFADEGEYCAQIMGACGTATACAQLLVASPPPRLAISQEGGAVVVSWPLPARHWLLECALELPLSAQPNPWSQVAFPYQTNAGQISITVPMPAGNRFYRLRRIPE
jgi:hypothetical protein